MMWEAFCGTGKSRIVVGPRQEGIRGGITAKNYLNILDEELAKFYEDSLILIQKKYADSYSWINHQFDG